MTPENENPQPSEHDPPPGWNTGQSGGSGSSTSKSRASLSLRPPTIFRLLALTIPVQARQERISSQTPLVKGSPSAQPNKFGRPPGAIPGVDPSIKFDTPPSRSFFITLIRLVHPRAPVETPPTEYLPYPPPPNYQWPAGTSPGTQNPPPSEFNPPAGWYGGTGQGNPGAVSGSGSTAGSNPGAAPDNGATPQAQGTGKKFPLGGIIAIVAVVVIMLLVLAYFLWRKKKRSKMAAGAEPPGDEGDDD